MQCINKLYLYVTVMQSDLADIYKKINVHVIYKYHLDITGS